MDEKYLVSIVVPTYNRGYCIEESLESALNQTYKNIEVIVVDDGSTDNTQEILNTLARERKVKYFYQENQGPSAARNLGVERAGGKYLAFLDSDDTWTEDKIEKQMKFLKENPQFKMVVSEGIGARELEGYSRRYRVGVGNDLVDKKEELIKAIFYARIWLCLVTILVEKDAFKRVGGFDEELFSGEDRFFAMNFLTKYKIGFLEEVVFYRGTQDDNLTNISDELQIEEKSKLLVEKSCDQFEFIRENEANSWLASMQAGHCIQSGNRMRSLKYIFKAFRLNPMNRLTFKAIAALMLPVSKKTLNKLIYWWLSKKG